MLISLESSLSITQLDYELEISITHRNRERIIAFDKERVHNAVKIDILGIFGRLFIVTISASPKIIQGLAHIPCGYRKLFYRAD